MATEASGHANVWVEGGGGTRSLETEDNWQVPGEAAVVLRPTAAEDQ
jgi:hypothetical protein